MTRNFTNYNLDAYSEFVQNSFNSLQKIKIDNKEYNYYSIPDAEKNGLDGISNIISLIISSIIERSPLAPVFLSIALSTIASIASGSNTNSTSSISNNF